MGPVFTLAAALALPPRRVVRMMNEGKVDVIYESSSPAYLNTQRPLLLGEVSSHELLEADNRNGVLEPSLARDTSRQQFVFVDEPSCIGCRELRCVTGSLPTSERCVCARQATALRWPAALSGWRRTSARHESSSSLATSLTYARTSLTLSL